MKDQSYPMWAIKFLRSICPDHLLEEIEGDLIQRFNADVKKVGLKKARFKFTWNTIRYCRPGILMRNKPLKSTIRMYMLTHYLKIASRVLIRSKSFSAINILGLALGITGAMLLFLWIEHEYGYDRFHADKERIFKAWNRTTIDGQVQCWDQTPRILAPTLVNDFTTVEAAVSYAVYSDSYLFMTEEKRIKKNTVVFADPQLLTMFTFPLIKGEPDHALDNPSSIVLTESFARQLFGDVEAFGESLTIQVSGYSFPFTVTGILKDLPSNTDFNFEYLIPWQFLESLGEKDVYWSNNSVSTFVKLKAGTDVASFNEEIKDIRKIHTSGEDDTEVFLYPLIRMHLYSRFENGVPAGGRIEIMHMLGILGICLIAIACINFVNLSTARAQRRAREVAVRKVAGAYRRSLIMQFLCESVLIALAAGLLSLLAVYISLPFFNNLVQQQFSLNFGNAAFWIFVVAFIVLIGMVAGSYPAFYLSSFEPVRILKGARISLSTRGVLRQLLVIFQFGFAITLIVSAVVIREQIIYVQDRDAGYARDGLIYHDITGDLEKNYQAYINELIQSGVAVSVTRTSSPITERMSSTTEIQWRGKDTDNNAVIERFYIDENISNTARLTIVEGRDMDLQHFPSDSNAVLLNESAVRLMSFDSPIGEVIIDNGREWHVVGVIKDFVFNSPFQKIEPMVLQGGKGQLGVVHIRLSDNGLVSEKLDKLSSIFSTYNPDYPFEYHFVDEVYQRKFYGIKATLTIATLFTSIAVFIACLGLLGLSTFIIEVRVKEIGIRKVMGGTTFNIVKMLGMDSLRPIIIAVTCFTPIGWMIMRWWLESFAYRISLNGWVFFASAFTVLSIAMITISIQTFNAAKTNPVKCLRNE